MEEAPKPNTPPAENLEEIEGTVENITYASDSGDYVVAQFSPP